MNTISLILMGVVVLVCLIGGMIWIGYAEKRGEGKLDEEEDEDE